MDNERTIQLIQSPIIKHSLEQTGKSVSERIADLNIDNQVATESTIQTLKGMRAELNKEAKEYEAQRKIIKDAVLSPYNDFETIYKSQIIEKYKEADTTLKNKINSFEMEIKIKRKSAIQAYFDELCQMEQLEWLTFDRLSIEVNLSTSEKKYKEQILQTVQRIVDDIDLIKTESHASEILIEFKKSLNSSQAIKTVRTRKEAEKIEAERLQAERTAKRTALLRSLCFVSHDLTKTYNWIKDETVLIKYADVENLSEQDWQKKYLELEVRTKAEEKPQILHAPSISAPAPEPPKEEPPKEELFQAKFIVSGTYQELKQLGEFLKSNNYNYQNID